MKHLTTRAGELNVVLTGALPGPPMTPTTEAEPLLIVFCHGFGAPGGDLVPLAAELVTLEPRLSACCFAFPEGPLDLSPLGLWGGRAWFPIDVAAFEAGDRPGRTDLLAAAEPPGMGSARKQLHVAISALMRGRPWSRVVLGGFSQGAMMALDLALRLEEAPAAVLAFSPTLLNRAVWERGAALHKGLTVMISHGRQDPLLPIEGTEALVALLTGAGLAVDYLRFDGPHTIPAVALTRAAMHLAGLA